MATLQLRRPSTKFKPGEAHPRWRGGVSVNQKGYRRMWAGAARGQYEHRMVMRELLRSPIGLVFTPGQDIPDDMTVHHVDFDKKHNCHGNLMLLEKVIHDAVSLWSADYKARILDELACDL